MRLCTNIEFAAYLSYTTAADSEKAKRSQHIRTAIKYDKKVGDPPILTSKKIVADITRELKTLPFANFFGEKTLLIPVAGHAVTSPNTFWLTHRIVQEMQRNSLGITSDCLRRTTKIRKSAFCKAEDRPTVNEHIKTMKCTPTLHTPTHIVLVDDIVTSGTTLLACANVLQRQFPNTRIRRFALMRYENTPTKFIGVKDPVIGTITLRKNGRTTRKP